MNAQPLSKIPIAHLRVGMKVKDTQSGSQGTINSITPSYSGSGGHDITVWGKTKDGGGWSLRINHVLADMLVLLDEATVEMKVDPKSRSAKI